MKKSIIKISGIFAEDLFSWFYEHVLASGGDGAGSIVCENYRETADLFLKWLEIYHKQRYEYLAKNGTEFFHPRTEGDGFVNFHDSNENFIFKNRAHDSDGNFGDYVFYVVGDCEIGWTEKLRGKKILAMK